MAPVIVDGVTLFSVRGVSAYPAERRAEEIGNRIVAVAANRAIPTSVLKLSELPNGTVIQAGNQAIMTVLDADAQTEGVDRHVQAQVHLSRIAEAINAYRADREPWLLARRAFYALGATLVFIAAIFLGRRAVRRLHSIFETRYRDRIRGVVVQSFELIGADQLRRILTGLEDFVCLTALVIAAYLWLHIVLSLFPWTRGVGSNLASALVNSFQTMAAGIIRVVPDILFLVVLALVTRYVLTLIRLVFTAIENGTITLRNFDPEWAKPTYRLVRIAVVAFALVVAYPYIPGSDSDAFKGVSIFIGVLVSLGSTSLIGNIMAGYTLMYRRVFKPGDRVRIGDHLGDVERSSAMATYLRTPKNEMLVVPNSKILAEEVLNYSTLAQRQGLILHTMVGVGYDAPWRQVEAMLLEAAARSPGVLREPKPFILQKTLGVFAVTYELNAYSDQPHEMGKVYTQLHQNILDVFNEYGVQIMTPAYEGDPGTAKVVPRAHWYAAPATPSDDRQFPKAS
jgi:small-conductance mechanosensitive channel